VKFWDNIGEHSYFPEPLPDSLCHISFSRYSPLSVEFVEKPKFFGPIFSGRMTLTFLRHIVSVTYRPLFGKVWLSSVCWSRSAASHMQIWLHSYGWESNYWCKSQQVLSLAWITVCAHYKFSYYYNSLHLGYNSSQICL